MTKLHRRARIRASAILGITVAALGTAWGIQTATAATNPPPQKSAAAITLPADVQKALNDLKDVTPGPGFVPASAYLAKGTQTYTCTSAGSWPTSGSVPEATLVRLPLGGDTIHHYAGPRWEAKDGSILLGTVRTRVPKSGTIPWLLLDVTHEGNPGALTPVTNVSRILTSGGMAPAGACAPGTTTSPADTAVYVCWVPTPKG